MRHRRLLSIQDKLHKTNEPTWFPYRRSFPLLSFPLSFPLLSQTSVAVYHVAVHPVSVHHVAVHRVQVCTPPQPPIPSDSGSVSRLCFLYSPSSPSERGSPRSPPFVSTSFHRSCDEVRVTTKRRFFTWRNEVSKSLPILWSCVPYVKRHPRSRGRDVSTRKS